MIEELDGHVPARATTSAKDAAAHYRAIIGAFTETIRLSDFKANVAIVFSGIMMGPVISFKDKLPKFLPLDIALAPFLLVFLCLLICLYPRYVSEGRVRFIIARNAAPELFTGPDSEEVELEKLQTLCAILSRILYWKTLMLLISFYTAIFTVTAMALIVLYEASPLAR
jgi:TctA family transporter